MPKIGSPRIRRLCLDDLASAMALKDAAGWNQTEDDWRLLLRLLPEGCFALEKDGRVIATSTAAPYGDRFGWVGMMLVHPEERRRGYGTLLLREAVSFLEERGLVVALDATPLGKMLYDEHGFRDLSRLERWTGVVPPGRKAHPGCSRLDASGLEEILALDLEAFGADRVSLLRGLLDLPGASGFVFRAGGRAEGYLLSRPGSRFGYLGPCVCRTPAAAGALWDTALSSFAGTSLGVDVFASNEDVRSLAVAAGLSLARTPIRMARALPERAGHATGEGRWPRGDVPPGGRPDLIYCLAGLEWG